LTGLQDFERTADPAKFQALIDQNLFLKQQENGMHSGLGSVHGSTPLAETLSRAFRTIEERYTRNPAVSKPDVVAAPPKSKLFGKSKASTSVPLITLHDVCPYQRPVHMPAKLRIIYDGAPVCFASSKLANADSVTRPYWLPEARTYPFPQKSPTGPSISKKFSSKSKANSFKVSKLCVWQVTAETP
jgi:hypothetical protein